MTAQDGYARGFEQIGPGLAHIIRSQRLERASRWAAVVGAAALVVIAWKVGR